MKLNDVVAYATTSGTSSARGSSFRTETPGTSRRRAELGVWKEGAVDALARAHGWERKRQRVPPPFFGGERTVIEGPAFTGSESAGSACFSPANVTVLLALWRRAWKYDSNICVPNGFTRRFSLEIAK